MKAKKARCDDVKVKSGEEAALVLQRKWRSMLAYRTTPKLVSEAMTLHGCAPARVRALGYEKALKMVKEEEPSRVFERMLKRLCIVYDDGGKKRFWMEEGSLTRYTSLGRVCLCAYLFDFFKEVALEPKLHLSEESRTMLARSADLVKVLEAVETVCGSVAGLGMSEDYCKKAVLLKNRFATSVREYTKAYAGYKARQDSMRKADLEYAWWMLHKAKREQKGRLFWSERADKMAQLDKEARECEREYAKLQVGDLDKACADKARVTEFARRLEETTSAKESKEKWTFVHAALLCDPKGDFGVYEGNRRLLDGKEADAYCVELPGALASLDETLMETLHEELCSRIQPQPFRLALERGERFPMPSLKRALQNMHDFIEDRMPQANDKRQLAEKFNMALEHVEQGSFFYGNPEDGRIPFFTAVVSFVTEHSHEKLSLRCMWETRWLPAISNKEDAGVFMPGIHDCLKAMHGVIRRLKLVGMEKRLRLLVSGPTMRQRAMQGLREAADKELDKSGRSKAREWLRITLHSITVGQQGCGNFGWDDTLLYRKVHAMGIVLLVCYPPMMEKFLANGPETLVEWDLHHIRRMLSEFNALVEATKPMEPRDDSRRRLQKWLWRSVTNLGSDKEVESLEEVPGAAHLAKRLHALAEAVARLIELNYEIYDKAYSTILPDAVVDFIMKR